MMYIQINIPAGSSQAGRKADFGGIAPDQNCGFRTEGCNVARAADDPERFANAKVERFWRVREKPEAAQCWVCSRSFS